jgi:hypothetical protein
MGQVADALERELMAVLHDDNARLRAWVGYIGRHAPEMFADNHPGCLLVEWLDAAQRGNAPPRKRARKAGK